MRQWVYEGEGASIYTPLQFLDIKHCLHGLNGLYSYIRFGWFPRSGIVGMVWLFGLICSFV